jgi:hypothetical protein
MTITTVTLSTQLNKNHKHSGRHTELILNLSNIFIFHLTPTSYKLNSSGKQKNKYALSWENTTLLYLPTVTTHFPLACWTYKTCVCKPKHI